MTKENNNSNTKTKIMDITNLQDLQDENFLSVGSIINSGSDEEPFLIKGFAPVGSPWLITGDNSIGKSTLIFNIAISLVTKKALFNKYDIMDREEHFVWIICTEDSIQDLKSLLKLMTSSPTFTEEDKQKIYNNIIVMADTCEYNDKLKEKLEQIKDKDLLPTIIFKDMGVDGIKGDINNMTVVREEVYGNYQKLLEGYKWENTKGDTYNIIFAITHHIGKKARKNSNNSKFKDSVNFRKYSKDLSSGSTALEDRPRLVLSLADEGENNRLLAATKFNALKKDLWPFEHLKINEYRLFVLDKNYAFFSAHKQAEKEKQDREDFITLDNLFKQKMSVRQIAQLIKDGEVQLNDKRKKSKDAIRSYYDYLKAKKSSSFSSAEISFPKMEGGDLCLRQENKEEECLQENP